MNIYEKLAEIQLELNCPKNQYNKFGGYNYRNCEDILEAAKPICKKYKTLLLVNDELVLIGERYYIKATAKLVNLEKPEEVITNESYAREEEKKTGMDLMQLTGATSSYARKYALNGLLAIDDNKDSDTTNVGQNKTNTTKTQVNATKQQEFTKPDKLKPTDKLGFGKYADNTWQEIYNTNEKYFDYLIKNGKDKSFVEQIRQLYLELCSNNDFEKVDVEYADDFEQVLIQQRNANE